MNAVNPTFVAVVSHSYSGSTLLALLLGAHPQIATVGEMNGPNPARVDISRYSCSCGQLIRECEFWGAVRGRMHDRGFEFDVADFNTRFVPSGHPLKARLRLGSLGSNTLESIRDAVVGIWPGQIYHLNRIVARNEAFIRAVLEVTGKPVFVDTSKPPWRFKYLSRFSTLDVRVVYLVRDVKGVVASELRRTKKGSAREAAQGWVKRNAGIRRLLKLLPGDKYTMVRYEDLCRDPADTLERLCRFCQADPSVDLLSFQSMPQHHIVGNTMRLRNLSEVKLDERWEEELSGKQLAEIARVAGALSQQYGY